MAGVFLALFAAFALVPACRPVITFMGYPDVDFDLSMASETAPGVTLAEGASSDGTKALRMSSWSQESEGRTKAGRLWVQCLGATLEVLVVTESTFKSNERCMRLDATVNDMGLAPMGGETPGHPDLAQTSRRHETRACVSHYSPRVLSVENPVAFVGFLGNAGEMNIVLAGDEERQLSLTFAPFTDPAFMERIWEECPRDWQPEISGPAFEDREDGAQEAGSQDGDPQNRDAGLPAHARRVDPHVEPAAFPGADARPGAPAPAAPAQTPAAAAPVSAGESVAARAPAPAVQASEPSPSPASSDGDMEERMRRLEETAKAASEL